MEQATESSKTSVEESVVVVTRDVVETTETTTSTIILENKSVETKEQVEENTASKKKALSKEAYLKLHRSSFHNPKSSTSSLKEKFEQSENVKTESCQSVKTECESSEIKTTVNSVQNTSETASEDSQESKTADNCSDAISQTTSNIEKLQNQLLANKVAPQAVESLRQKYSPSSYGYPKTAALEQKIKKVTFAPSPTVKPIPLPKPQKLASPTSPTPEKHVVVIKEVTPKSPVLITKFPINEKPSTENDTATNILEEKDAIEKKIDSAVPQEKDSLKKDTLEKKEKPIPPVRRSISLNSNQPKVQLLSSATQVSIEKVDKSEKNVQTSPCENKVIAVQTQTENEKVSIRPPVPKKPSRIPERRPISAIHIPKKDQVINRSRPLSNIETKKKKPVELPKNIVFADPEDHHLIVCRSSSEDSEEEINRVKSFLDDIDTMEKKKEKKRSSSFRKILTGSFFSKDKKKDENKKSKDEEKKGKTKKVDNHVMSDNVQNESNFSKGSSRRNSVPDNTYVKHDPRCSTSSNSKTNGSYTQDKVKHKMQQQNIEVKEDPIQVLQNIPKEVEERFAEMHINHYNRIRNNFENNEINQRYEGYVDMDNSRQAKENFNNFNANCKYIDTSSTNTTSSESKSDTYENALIAQAEMMQRREQEIRMQQEHNERVNARHRFMVENQNTNADNYSVTPPRAHDTYQSVQLIKPQKAHIPINSERPLPNPYHNGHQNVESNDKNAENEDKQVSPKLNPVSVKVDGDNLYGTVYDIKSVPAQVVISRNPQGITSSAKEASVYLNKPSEESRPMSPVSPKSVEGSKLRLPPNREKVELQPRIKSPIPQTKISTDKIIATELLKNKADKKDDKRSTPSHQRLEIEIDYPEGQRRSIASLSPRSSQMSPKSQLSPRSRSSLVETSPSHRMRSPAETTNSLLRVSPMQQQRQREELNTTPINHGKSIVMNEQSPKMAQNDWKNEQVHSSTPYNLSTNQSENGIDDQSDANVNNINISKSSNLNSPSSVHSANPSQSNLSTNSLIAQNNMQGRSPNLYAYSPNSLSPRSAQSGRYPSTQEIRPVTPVNASQTLKVQSPSKAELRQHVEAFCWKELKKLKEKEEQEIYQLQISNYGYAEDPVRRCRSVSPTTARGRRSLSLPRSNQRAPRNQQQPIPENRPPQPVNPTYGYIATTLPQNQFLRNSPQRRTVDVTYKRQDQEVDYRPIFKRGSLTPQNYQEQNVQISKKVSFPHGAVQNGQQNWPTKNGFTKSPPTRRLEKRESYVEDEVFLPPEESNQSQNMQNYMTYETPHGNKFTVPMGKDEQAKQELYGTNPNDPRQFAPNEDPYGTARGRPQNNYMSRPSSTIPTSEAQIKPAIENPYGSRTNDPRQFVQNEDPYGTARGRSTQSNYGSRPSSTLPIKNSEQDPQIKTIPENPYGSRQFIQNEDPYGQTRGRQMARSLKNELSEDPRMKAVEENPYGSRSNDPRQFQVPNEDSYGTSRGRQPSNYLPRPPSALAVNNVEPDGRGPKLQYSNSFRRNDVHDLNKQIRDNLLAKDASRNGALRDVRNIGNPDYVSRQQLNHGFEEQQRLGNVMYDPRRGPPMERYTSRQTLDESPYGSRQMIRGYPQDYQRNYQESPYGSRQSFASSTQLYGSKQSIQDPIYIQRQVTVSNKVCDMYGKIHEPGQPLSPTYGPVQEKGVLYGQLSRNPRGMTPQFDGNYPPLPPGNFIRGSRLTASANDMYKRHPQMAKRQMDNSMNQQFVYESRVTVRGVMPPPNDFDMMNAPTRPLPPIPNESKSKFLLMRRESARRYAPVYDGDTSSETSEVQRIMQNASQKPPEEEWNSDGKSGRGVSGNESGSGRSDTDGEVRSSRSRNARRDDPRRHTLIDQPYSMQGQGGPLSRTMDLEGQPRGYPPPSNAMLFDDDPGIMSEVETSSTGFRRGGKQRSSLPVVRTPSKTLERPLGLVFLQYRNETKRALLPNEITSIDTVKALFVRSFPKQLTMEYLDSPQVKIYIHDSSKDMFYELEDLRSHLREIRDRSVLRLFESADVSGGLPMAGIGIAGGVGHFEDPSYFSEPEFDSEYQHQHIHKSKGSKGAAPYYMGSTASLPRGATLLRAYSPAVGPIPPERLKPLPTDGYMSSPERGSRGYEDPYYSQYGTRSGSITPVIDEEVSDTELLDESYSLYGVKIPPGGPRAAPRTQFAPASVPYDATRIYSRIRVENMERQLANLTGLVQKALTQTPTSHLQVPSGRSEAYRSDKSVSFEKSVSFSDEPPDMNSPKQHSPQHAERDRLKPAPPPKPASLSPGQYDGRHIYRDLQLTPEMYNQLRGLQKKAKDLRAEVRNLRRMSQAQAHSVRETIRDAFIKIRAMLLAGGEQVWQAGVDQERVRLSREEDLYKQEMLRLEKDLSDLESTVEELRGNVINRKTRVNMSDVENMALILSKSSKTVADLKLRFPSLQDGMKTFLSSEMEKVVREEKFLKEEPERLESALRRCKKLTGTLVTLKRLASVQEQRLPCSATSTDGQLSPTITETPPITPTSAQHSKSTSGTRLGQVIVGGDGSNSADSNQRAENALDALLDELQTFSKPHPSTVSTQLPQVSYADSDTPPTLPAKGIAPSHSSHFNHPPTMLEIGRKGSMDSATILPTQNLTVSTTTGSLRRLHSYPSGSDTDNSPPIQPIQRIQVDSNKTANKPPVPERNAELLQHITGKRVPPPPPPRTSSKSPLASPTSPSLPPRSPATALQHIQNVQNMVDKPQSQFEAATQNLGFGTLRRNAPHRNSSKDRSQTLPRNIGSNLQIPNQESEGSTTISASNSSSCESVNSQDGSKKSTRKEELEHRHQELLKKQKALQEQYARLQQLQRGNNTLAVIPPAPDQLLKKTGSESNLLQKMGLQMSTAPMTGSLTNLPNTSANAISKTTLTNTNNTAQSATEDSNSNTNTNNSNSNATNKVYETDIL